MKHKFALLPETMEHTNNRGRCFIEFQLVNETTAVVLVYLINDDYSTSDIIYDSYKGDVIGAMDKYFEYAHLDSAILDAE